MPTELEEYLFDLQGYLHLENAIDRAHVTELNALIDTYKMISKRGNGAIGSIIGGAADARTS
jgi:hypothetical protein